MSIFNRFFCRHRGEVVCWHWTHGINGISPLFIEIQMKCNKCGKIYYRYIKNNIDAKEFANKHSDKRWSSKCYPIL